jgi:flagellar biosynthetic protein FliQ
MFGIETFVDLAREAIYVTLLVAAPILLTGFIVGITVSVLQAATQIQEQTLTFIPKILAMVGALFIFLYWIAGVLVNYTRELYIDIPRLVG